MFSRRGFLAASGLAAAGFTTSMLAAGSRAIGAPSVSTKASAAKKIPIGLELYSVRGELGRNLEKTVRAVAKIGYEAVEFYAPYFQWSFPRAKEIRSLLDDVGLRCYSTHNNPEALGESIGKAIELNQILGSRAIVLASASRDAKGVEGWKRFADRLAKASEQLQSHGLSGGFHNHQSEWARLENGQSAIEALAANTPREFILQLDVGTCIEAGADPVAWIKANPGRIRSLHLKDWGRGKESQEKGYRVLFGEGDAPWKVIFDAAESVGGVEWYLMEQEGSRYSEIETAERCFNNWTQMRS